MWAGGDQSTGHHGLQHSFHTKQSDTANELPIPLIDEILDAVGGKRIYSTMDLAWGYFQIPMAPGSEQKAALITQDGHYDPVMMQMGIKVKGKVFISPHQSVFF